MPVASVCQMSIDAFVTGWQLSAFTMRKLSRVGNPPRPSVMSSRIDVAL